MPNTEHGMVPAVSSYSPPFTMPFYPYIYACNSIALLFDVFLESGCPFRIRHLDDVIEGDTTGLHRKEKEKTLRYEHLNAEQFDVVDKLMRGGIRQESLPCQKPKVVRMFVCSSGPGKYG